MFRHLFNVLHSIVRESAKHGNVVSAAICGEAPRSSGWRKVEKEHLLAEPRCRACGGIKLLQVHHKQPFHEFKNLELDPNNLITLCMGEFECHLKIGHGDDWQMYNPNVIDDCRTALTRPEWRSTVEARAKRNRKA